MLKDEISHCVRNDKGRLWVLISSFVFVGWLLIHEVKSGATMRTLKQARERKKTGRTAGLFAEEEKVLSLGV